MTRQIRQLAPHLRDVAPLVQRPQHRQQRFLLFFLLFRRPPIPTLFPYTTLFRSVRALSRVRRLPVPGPGQPWTRPDRKSTRLNSSHVENSYAVFCLKKKRLGAEPNTSAADHHRPILPAAPAADSIGIRPDDEFEQ